MSWWLCIDRAKIITLRAIALKPVPRSKLTNSMPAKIITLRAIALKLVVHIHIQHVDNCEDHNATSYSTETSEGRRIGRPLCGEDHNATSYSTETEPVPEKKMPRRAKIITLRAIALKLSGACSSSLFAGAKIITLRAIALKRNRQRRQSGG